MAWLALPASVAEARRNRRGRRRRRRGHDHEDAQRELRMSKVKPLREILEVVHQTFPGEVVGVEFEQEESIWVYEIKIITPQNRYLQIQVNAHTTRILKVSGQ
ncbi:MAG: PepSY domain-containing protein [Anderseniella sp.]